MTIQKRPSYCTISIHAPREGGDVDKDTVVNSILLISIHAPREGGDNKFGKLSRIIVISIHAPREGGDDKVHLVADAALDFNPRPPRGGRR